MGKLMVVGSSPTFSSPVFVFKVFIFFVIFFKLWKGSGEPFLHGAKLFGKLQ